MARMDDLIIYKTRTHKYITNGWPGEDQWLEFRDDVNSALITEAYNDDMHNWENLMTLLRKYYTEWSNTFKVNSNVQIQGYNTSITKALAQMANITDPDLIIRIDAFSKKTKQFLEKVNIRTDDTQYTVKHATELDEEYDPLEKESMEIHNLIVLNFTTLAGLEPVLTLGTAVPDLEPSAVVVPKRKNAVFKRITAQIL